MVLRPFLPFVLFALAACQQPLVTDEDMARIDISKPIQVDRVRVQYDAAFQPGTSELPYDEALRLETFLDQTGVRPADEVFVASSPGDPLAAARAGRIAALLAERSVGMVPIAPPPAGVAANHVLILVDRFVAAPPACQNWTSPPATGHDNVPSNDFGCADATDLAAMVANPRDLALGRALGPADSDTPLDAVERYRIGLVKPLLSVGQQGSTPAPGAAPSSSSGASSATSGAGMSATPGASAASPSQ